MPAAIAVVGAAVLVAGLLDRRVLVVLITASIASNAPAVVAVERDLPDYLLPVALIALLVGAWDLATHPPPWTDAPDSVPLLWIGMALAGLATLSAVAGPFVSDHPEEASFQVSVLVKTLVVCTALALLVTADTRLLRPALYGLVLGITVVAAITDLQWLTGLQGNDLGGFGQWSTQQIAGSGVVPRAAGTFGGDPNSYAQHLAVGTGVAVGLAASARTRVTTKWGLLVAIALLGGAMLATASRTGMLALAAIGAVALVFWPPTRLQLAAIGVGVAAVVTGPFGVTDRLATLGQVTSAGQAGVDSSINGRTSEALTAVELFVEHPITGVGFGSYPPEYLATARGIGLESRLEPRSAHSLPLEIAAEQGLLGLAAWVGVAIFCVAVARRLVGMAPDLGRSYALGLVGFASTAVFLHDVYPRLMWALVALAVGGAAARGTAGARPDGRTGPVVAMVIHNYVPALGGAERQLANLVPRLRERGIRPVVITRSFPGRPERDEIDRVPVVRVPVGGPKPVQSLRFVVGARRELRALRPDVVHAFDTRTPSLVALGHRRATGTPFAVKILRSGPLGDLEVLRRKSFGARRLRSLLDRADRFVAISTDIAAELRSNGVPDHRITRIPNGVDTERFRPGDDAVRPSSGPRRVIATGRLAPEKRLGDVAVRWHGVETRHPGAELVVVGDGPERAELTDRSGVRVLGRRDDIPELLRTADLYVSASSAEGLSNSLLEAMASGLPCVVTDVGGVRDVIVDGVHGAIVDPDDLDALVERLDRLLSDPAGRRRVGRAARERVTDGWSLEATAAALSDLYLELADDTGSRGPKPDAASVRVP